MTRSPFALGMARLADRREAGSRGPAETEGLRRKSVARLGKRNVFRVGDIRRMASTIVKRRRADIGNGERPGAEAPGKARVPGSEGDADDAALAARVRRKLLERLEQMTEEIPDGAMTERKTQDDSAVVLFKLRDLTAAYKELTCDLPDDAEGGRGVRIILDV